MPQFKVRTVTDETTRFTSRDFFVRRRYRDFLWLRGQLTSTFPGAMVPPLPPVDKLYKGEDRFSAQFIQRRQAGLELFLRRVADHPALTTSTDLKTFLDAKVWELQTEKNKSTQSWYEKMLDTAGDGVKRVTNAKGSLMPEWEETAAVSCAVQNLHLMLTCEGYAGYWSSGGVAGDCAWANSDEVREMLGMTGECQGEPDRVLGFFHVGAVTPEGAAKYRGKRGALDDKVAWNPM